ncbi:endolytic transglycosylase MltG [Gordonia amarae]|nr:endolytic transglycosylase MltG [Gordonia amarae]QHN24358.1 endolytic transglycosylase MltG [Gordonia amarae]QHN33282.1 endolytic transglycosylase MltG [Gordonia amarae]QHN42002.1 endolytic transglycosylase MltG [Gordonia amarae]
MRRPEPPQAPSQQYVPPAPHGPSAGRPPGPARGLPPGPPTYDDVERTPPQTGYFRREAVYDGNSDTGPIEVIPGPVDTHTGQIPPSPVAATRTQTSGEVDRAAVAVPAESTRPTTTGREASDARSAEDDRPAQDERSGTEEPPAKAGRSGRTERAGTAGRSGKAGRAGKDNRKARSDDRDTAAADTARKRKRKRRTALAFVLVLFVAMLGAIGYAAMRAFGGPSAEDYTGATGLADVIVEIPENSTLSDFGTILADRDVVKSSQAFINAAGGRTMEGGFYKLRTQISASTAVDMMSDTSRVHRVGLMNVPEGLQLESKKGIDGKTTPGIFEMIADATKVDINGAHRGVTVKQLEKVAATADPKSLGVPEWARKWVTASDVKGDFRRIEGLIAPGTWEYINPEHSATQILSELISQSVSRFEKWGLLNDNGSGLTPYETLVTASVVEREAKNPEDFPKVARVILNRLAKDQRLEMDSTSNYKAEVTNIDVHGDAYSDENPWNTYQIFGLPPTPIGAVGERALESTEHPAKGRWLYFVSIDTDGTTLFANTYEEHKRNRQKACDTGLLSTGC